MVGRPWAHGFGPWAGFGESKIDPCLRWTLLEGASGPGILNPFGAYTSWRSGYCMSLIYARGYSQKGMRKLGSQDWNF